MDAKEEEQKVHFNIELKKKNLILVQHQLKKFRKKILIYSIRHIINSIIPDWIFISSLLILHIINKFLNKKIKLK